MKASSPSTPTRPSAHAHDHYQVTHSPDYSQAEEEERHGKEAHVHDHAAPTQSPG